MVKQHPVFLQVYIVPEKVEALMALLNTGGNPQMKGNFFPFEKLESVHFARWIIAPATDKFRASIVYSANIDGDVASHLKDLAETMAEGIDAIMEHCEGYPDKASLTSASRLEFLKKHSFSTPAFYVGAPTRSVSQVHNEAKLHEAVRDFVKSHKGDWKNAREASSAIRNFLSQDSQWDWAKEKFTPPKGKGLKMMLFLLLVVVLLPFILLGVLFIFLLYEWREKPYGKTINELPIEKVRAMKNQEDIIYQNQLSQVFETKGGLRKIMLRFLLWATNFAAANWFVKGKLMGTPTIHFARWVFIDGGKRFVFFSNFDGSFDGYLGDFVDNNGWGLNAIYGAAKGYPRTYFMFGGGSYKILEFLGWGRKTQVATPIWYSAYPWYGLQQIVSKSHLRAQLFSGKELNEEEAQEMLRRI